MKNIRFVEKEFLNSTDFRAATITINLGRGKLLAVIIILLESILAAIDTVSSFFKLDNRFQFSSYLVMYLVMIAVNITFLIWTRAQKNIPEKSHEQIRRIELVFILYVAFFMCWGSILSLMDQKLYGELAAFMINAFICLVIYNLDTKFIIVPFILSSSILVIGLPFYQSSGDILLGHYVNLSVFLVLSWIASRIVFDSHYKQFLNMLELNKSKAMLEAETRINVRNNAKLKEINQHLKKLSMFDELTKLPNRRSFRNFIDYHFENTKINLARFSVIMIDVDHFKLMNDEYGHSIGDSVLKKIAGQINSCTSTQTDFAARWGGDEFIYASFNRNEDEITKMANLLRNKILSLNIESKSPLKTPNITVSLGTCSMKITGKDIISKCIENADKALYSAKTAGRNCVKNYSEISPSDPYKS